MNLLSKLIPVKDPWYKKKFWLKFHLYNTIPWFSACEMGQVVTRSDRWIFSHVQNHTNVNAGANKNDLCNLFRNLNVK